LVIHVDDRADTGCDLASPVACASVHEDTLTGAPLRSPLR
jgi:hypothetical protein